MSLFRVGFAVWSFKSCPLRLGVADFERGGLLAATIARCLVGLLEGFAAPVICCAVLCRAVLCCAVLCYAMLCYAMLPVV